MTSSSLLRFNAGQRIEIHVQIKMICKTEVVTQVVTDNNSNYVLHQLKFCVQTLEFSVSLFSLDKKTLNRMQKHLYVMGMIF